MKAIEKCLRQHELPNSKLTIARCNTLLCVICDAVLSFTLSTQYIVYIIPCMLAHKIITQWCDTSDNSETVVTVVNSED